MAFCQKKNPTESDTHQEKEKKRSPESYKSTTKMCIKTLRTFVEERTQDENRK